MKDLMIRKDLVLAHQGPLASGKGEPLPQVIDQALYGYSRIHGIAEADVLTGAVYDHLNDSR